MNERVDPRRFRAVCGRFATGVTIVLTQTGDTMCGMTANAFMSLSLEPFLVTIAVRRQGRLGELLAVHQTPFSLSVLASDQQHLAELYSRPGTALVRDAYQGLSRVGPGFWTVKGAQGWMACRVRATETFGDHRLVIADVEDCDFDAPKPPLIFYRGRYFERLGAERDDPSERQLWEL